MIQGFIITVILTFIVYLLFTILNKRVTRSMALEETTINTSLKEFRESHAVTNHIRSTSFDAPKSIVEKYEQMCVIDPVTYKNHPELASIIRQYQDIISGRALDPQGLNVPSEELLGRHNPDYDRYLENQAKALKSSAVADVLRTEKNRVVRLGKETDMKNQFFVYLIEQDVAPLIVSAAMTDAKLNTFNDEDWRTFCKVMKGYSEVADHITIMNFVSMFDDKEILFNQDKFTQYVAFSDHKVPSEIVEKILTDSITIDQALRMVELAESCDCGWDEALSEIVSEDLNKIEATELRKQYGWEG